MANAVYSPDPARIKTLWQIAICSIMLYSLFFPGVLMAASSDINVKVCYPPTIPSITSPADGFSTKESSVLVAGSGPANAIINIFNNDAHAGFVNSGSNGAYTLSINLINGNNLIQASAKNDCGESARSASVSVRRHGNPPRTTRTTTSTSTPGLPLQPSQEPLRAAGSTQPVITEPRSGTTSQSPIVVKGYAPPSVPVRITLNERLVAEVLSDENGNFAASIPLVEGENRIVSRVTIDGREVKSSVVIINYLPPNPLAYQSNAQPKWTSWLILGLSAITFLGLAIFIFRRHHRRAQSASDVPPDSRFYS